MQHIVVEMRWVGYSYRGGGAGYSYRGGGAGCTYIGGATT